MSTRLSGFALIDKPGGVTSFKALDPVKRKVRPAKVGHTGTLDKFAEGLLIAVVGKFTRFAPYITNMTKEYEAEIVFGTETDTLDPEGETVQTSTMIPDLQKVEEAVSVFVGTLEQFPPKYSAVHINGKRASDLMRQGKDPEMKSRTITIYDIAVRDYRPPSLFLSVTCSKGTYIRSLARDIGYACGSCAYVRTLRRTKIGPVDVDEAVGGEDFDPETDMIAPIDLFGRFDFISLRRVKDEHIPDIQNGKPFQPDFFKDTGNNGPVKELIGLFDERDRFIALIEDIDNRYRYKFVGADR